MLHVFYLARILSVKDKNQIKNSLLSHMTNRKENEIIIFEDLPNELFCQIFSYLSGVDTVFAFSLLNRRFQCLLKEYCHGFDFQLINKMKFDIIFEQYNKQWWKSLKLSNEDIPGQIEYFFQCYSLIDEISQLKSLSLLNIESMNKSILLSQISFLTNLVSLTLKPICGRILLNIDLSKLKRLVVTSCRNTEWIKVGLLKCTRFYLLVLGLFST
jgi:hypothetical protein